MKLSEHTPIHWSPHLIRYCCLTLLLIVVLITSWLASDGELRTISEQLLGGIYSENHAYISTAANRAESMLITLSELNAGLAVLQSSDFGISFILNANIKLGNILSQLTELVSHGRNYALYNLIALQVLDNLMHLIKWLTPWLLLAFEAALLCLIATESWLPEKNRWHMSLVRFSEATMAVSLLLMVVIPLSVTLVSHSSKSVTEVFYHKSYEAIVDTHQHILQNNDESSIKTEATGALSQFKSTKVNLSQKSGYLASNMATYIAITVLEVIILPFLFSLLMFWLCTTLIKRHRHWRK